MIQLTKAEEEIMQQLWSLQEGSVAMIIDQMQSPKPAYNTVSTVVRILETKGFVSHRKKGKGFIYFPIIKKEAYTKQSLSKLANNYFQGSFKSMVSFFIKEKNIDVQDLEAILKDINTKND